MFTPLFTMLMLSFGCSEDEIKVDTGLTHETAVEDTGSDTEDTQVTDTSTTIDTADTSDTDQDTSVDTAIVDTAVNDTGEPIDTGSTTRPGPNAVTDFVLPDINPASSTLGQNISPRDYLQQISGWDFIKAT